MKRTSGPKVFSLLPAVAFCATLALSSAAIGASPVIKVDGSSTVFLISQAVAEEMTKAGTAQVDRAKGVPETSSFPDLAFPDIQRGVLKNGIVINEIIKRFLA